MNDPSAIDRFTPLKRKTAGAARATRWMVALAVLALLACAAYFWLVRDMSRRAAVAAETPNTTVTNAPDTAMTNAASDATSALPAIAPVVTPAAAVADLGDIADAEQRRAVCGYLAAELARLDYEFKQPLPPPVIDDIATQVTQLRAQADHYACANPPSGVNAIAPVLPVTVSQPPTSDTSDAAESSEPSAPSGSSDAPVRRPEPPMLIEKQPE